MTYRKSSRFLTVHLMGGLGNQIFIFLAAKKYATSIGKELRLNIDSYTLDPHAHRVQPLLHFIFENIEYTKTSILDRLKLYSLDFAKLYYKLQLKTKRNKYVQNIPYSLYEKIPNVNIDFLFGYFQHKKYYDDQLAAMVLTEYFTKLRNGFKVRRTDVAIHYRNYESFGNLIDEYPIELDYYLKAIDYVMSNCINPRFYIFSNDQESAEDFFHTLRINVNFVKGNYTDLEEFCHLSSFNYIIISNSTFSYWAARITPKETIVCPKLYGHKSSPHWVNGALPDDFVLI